jgi:hypothetical protein
MFDGFVDLEFGRFFGVLAASLWIGQLVVCIVD